MKDICCRDFLTKPSFGGDLGASRYPQIFVILKWYLFNIQHPQLCIAERRDNLEQSKQLRKHHDDNQIVEIWAPFLSDIMKGFIRVWQWPWKEAEILSVEANQTFFSCIHINVYRIHLTNRVVFSTSFPTWCFLPNITFLTSQHHLVSQNLIH